MRVLTAWAQDGPATAAMTWRYPATAQQEFPSGAINAALAAIYNHPNEALDNPYVFIARDADHQQIGIVITDPEGVTLDQPDINALYAQVSSDGRWWGDERRVKVNLEGDTWVIRWPFPSGYCFPVDPLNEMLAALYNAGVRPFVYPVYDRADEESELRQVGLLVSAVRDLPGDASENWRTLRDDFRTIVSDDELHPTEAPWGQREWDLE